MKKLLLILIIAFSTVLSPISVMAGPCDNSNLSASAAVTCGVQGASGDNQQPVDAQKTLSGTIQKGLNIASALIALLAVIMFIYAGFRYVTSAGSQEGVKAAKDTMVYAVVGLVIVALAQAIVHFVINNV